MENGIPPAPFGLVIDPTVQTWMLIIFGGGAFSTLLYAVKKAWSEKNILPVYLWIGALLTVVIEPIADRNGLAIYPEIGQVVGYRCFGRSIPLYNVFLFAFYFGPGVKWLIDRFENGITSAWLMKCFLIGSVLTAIFEMPPLHFGAWLYYGNQPFTFFGFPLWWGPNNAANVILTAIAIFKVLPYLPGWRKVAVIPLMPIAAVLAHSALGLPAHSVLNSGQGEFVKTLGTSAAAILSVFLVWLGSKFVFEKPVID